MQRNYEGFLLRIVRRRDVPRRRHVRRSSSARPAPARAPRRSSSPTHFGDPQDLDRRHLPGQRLGRHRARQAGQEVHGRRRPGARRGHQRDGPRPAGRAGRRDGFLLDGFPRNVPQADELDGILDDLGTGSTSCSSSSSTTTRSSAGCPAGGPADCGHIWHVDFDPPLASGICDICGGELFQRDDDKPETVRHRLEVYAEQTAPLIAFYAESGLLVGIDALGRGRGCHRAGDRGAAPPFAEPERRRRVRLPERHPAQVAGRRSR